MRRVSRLRLLLVVLFGGGLLATVLPAGAASAAPAYTVVGSQLSAGAVLHPGEELLNPSGNFGLVMQTDGNLVAYSCPPNGTTGGSSCPFPLWSLGTYGRPGNYLTMQTDGNLVLYTVDGRPVWSSRTYGSGSADVFRVQDDTNLVIYGSGGAVWWTGSPFSYLHVAVEEGFTVVAYEASVEPNHVIALVKGDLADGDALSTLVQTNLIAS